MLLIAAASAATAFAEPIKPYITIESEKELNRGISLKVTEPADVYPFFGSGVVMNTGSSNDDPRNYGKYIETFTEISYEVEGEKLTDLIFIVYSNMRSINVKQGDIIDAKTVIGTAFGEGTPVYPDSTDFYIYLYTMDLSPYLLKMTKGGFINSEDALWWDPGFLIKQS
jgi:hypothetical protein